MNLQLIEKVYDLFLKSSGVCTDTRTIKQDSLFFCLKGENFNANQFASQALLNGALAVVVDEVEFATHPQIILVENSLTFLQNLATYHRKKFNIPIIGITGTNGKTTTKELITTVLSTTFRTHSTQGNFNNHIGVPLTLLAMPLDTQIAVVEMGANHQGEIDQLSNIALPDYGIITNIGKAHLEGFGGYEGVKKTKNELYVHIKNSGKMVFVNGDDDLLMGLSASISRFTYGQLSHNEIVGELSASNPFLSLVVDNQNIHTKLLGDYNFSNVLAAIAIGRFFNIDAHLIFDAIAHYEPNNKRSQFVQTAHNQLYLDAYNANPTSMLHAITSFLNFDYPNKMLILGDMLELGDESIKEHQQIVDLVANNSKLQILLVGSEFLKTTKLNSIKYFANTTEAAIYLQELQPKQNYILIKGSRGIGLEKLLDFI